MKGARRVRSLLQRPEWSTVKRLTFTTDAVLLPSLKGLTEVRGVWPATLKQAREDGTTLGIERLGVFASYDPLFWAELDALAWLPRLKSLELTWLPRDEVWSNLIRRVLDSNVLPRLKSLTVLQAEVAPVKAEVLTRVPAHLELTFSSRHASLAQVRVQREDKGWHFYVTRHATTTAWQHPEEVVAHLRALGRVTG